MLISLSKMDFRLRSYCRRRIRRCCYCKQLWDLRTIYTIIDILCDSLSFVWLDLLRGSWIRNEIFLYSLRPFTSSRFAIFTTIWWDNWKLEFNLFESLKAASVCWLNACKMEINRWCYVMWAMMSCLVSSRHY